MPNASAPSPPWVQVWLSPQTIRQPGRLRPSSGPMTWTMPWPGLVDIEHLDAAGRGLDPQRRQQFLPDLAGAGAAVRGRNRVVRRRKGQFGIVDRKVAALEIEQAARAAEIVQQMAIDMEQIGIIADAGDDMLVPDLGQHGAAKSFQASCFQVISSLIGHGVCTVVRRFGAA